jgi:CubicO group peptidase (beta-lactamase class C family)
VLQYCVSRYRTGVQGLNPLLFDGVRVIAAFLALVLVQAPNALPPSRDQLFALYGRYLDALRIQAGIPGLAAAIVDSDGIAWQQAYGVQDTSRSLATRTDTPFHLDGLTQLFTATLVLRCVENGRLTLDTPMRAFVPADNPDAGATVGEILTHTSGDPRDPTFLYRPARLDVLAPAVSACTGLPFRVAVAGLLNSQAMIDSVPGPDAPLDPALIEDSERYTSVLQRLALPYSVNDDRRSSLSHYTPTTLTPSAGLISTVLDFAQFDRGLRQGLLLRDDTLAAAWRPPVGRNGSLPHGYGWFVQTYKNEPVIWQFGIDANASSSLVMTLPARDLTLVMVANSDALAKPATLALGDIIVSPFARTFFQLLIK